MSTLHIPAQNARLCPQSRTIRCRLTVNSDSSAIRRLPDICGVSGDDFPMAYLSDPDLSAAWGNMKIFACPTGARYAFYYRGATLSCTAKGKAYFFPYGSVGTPCHACRKMMDTDNMRHLMGECIIQDRIHIDCRDMSVQFDPPTIAARISKHRMSSQIESQFRLGEPTIQLYGQIIATIESIVHLTNLLRGE